ncbi:MAG: DUF2752 domain-containing protein [Oligoflexia bacterium]|nr:DUF2752 domain-containing protein [Oligoflexia bacterium]
MAEGDAALDRQASRAARTRRRNAEADAVILAISVGVIILSTLLSPDPQTLSLFGYQIPTLCIWKNLTGWNGPGCGLTRSFTYMGHLMPVAAFGMHKLGPLLWIATLAQIPWRLRLLWRARLVPPPRSPRPL